MSTWVYLTDMCPQAKILNPETGEIREIMSSAVKNRAPSGLRRTLLDELGGGVYEERVDVLPLTSALADDIEDAYRPPNSWNYDWPHLEIEQAATPEMEAHVMARLSRMMDGHPYDFQITSLQRRFLLYYSDGNYETQQRFERLIPTPEHSSPFRRDGQLRRRYDWVWNSIMRDAGVPFPKREYSQYGGLKPLLYMGPAWCVRFTLDGVDVLLDRCRVYVTDEAEFICSDWCQRHDYTSYNNGINLQTGIYSFDGWVTGPCVIKNIESGKFTPKQVSFKRQAVRELLKTAPPAVPEYDAVFAKAQAVIQKFKPIAPTAPTPSVDAGPITADAMAEALAVSEQLWAAKAAATAAPDATSEPALPSDQVFDAAVALGPGYILDGPYLLAAVPPTHGADPTPSRHLVLYDTSARTNRGDPYVRAQLMGYVSPEGDVFLSHSTKQRASNPISIRSVVPALYMEDGFVLMDEPYPDGAFAWFIGNKEFNPGDETLTDHWWMWSAAKYYQTLMPSTAVAAMLLEAECRSPW